jgi:hypothetical protein
MNVVSESILVRCQYVAMAVCAAGMLFCWGKSITHLHDPGLLVDHSTDSDGCACIHSGRQMRTLAIASVEAFRPLCSGLRTAQQSSIRRQ